MRYWTLTDPGCVRTQNQDTFAVKKLKNGAVLFVVCDGMGGARSGNVASSLAAEVFTKEMRHNYSRHMTQTDLDKLIEWAVRRANTVVYQEASNNPDYEGMGTTLTAVLIRGTAATVINVGDSRTYHISQGITQITEDHSLVQMMVRRGELSKEQAKLYPGKNLITRAIGTEPGIQCDLYHVELAKGDNMLLCSDGLSNLLHEQEMLFEIEHGKKAECCQRLLEIAKQRGAPDNVTSVLVQI